MWNFLDIYYGLKIKVLVLELHSVTLTPYNRMLANFYLITCNVVQVLFIVYCVCQYSISQFSTEIQYPEHNICSNNNNNIPELQKNFNESTDKKLNTVEEIPIFIAGSD